MLSYYSYFNTRHAVIWLITELLQIWLLNLFCRDWLVDKKRLRMLRSNRFLPSYKTTVVFPCFTRFKLNEYLHTFVDLTKNQSYSHSTVTANQHFSYDAYIVYFKKQATVFVITTTNTDNFTGTLSNHSRSHHASKHVATLPCERLISAFEH